MSDSHSPCFTLSLYWNKIQEEAVGGTLWLKLDDSKVQLDVSALERDFAAVAPGIGGEGREVPKISAEGIKGREDKGKPIQLIEAKRWQNCSIALARLRRSPEEVKTAILAMDDSVINPERCKKRMFRHTSFLLLVSFCCQGDPCTHSLRCRSPRSPSSLLPSTSLVVVEQSPSAPLELFLSHIYSVSLPLIIYIMRAPYICSLKLLKSLVPTEEEIETVNVRDELVRSDGVV